jgi:UTP-glucose-1-phosphate uridylyltransferase
LIEQVEKMEEVEYLVQAQRVSQEELKGLGDAIEMREFV